LYQRVCFTQVAPYSDDLLICIVKYGTTQQHKKVEPLFISPIRTIKRECCEENILKINDILFQILGNRLSELVCIQCGHFKQSFHFNLAYGTDTIAIGISTSKLLALTAYMFHLPL